MKGLKIANDITLPLDAVTQTFLVVGKRGSGKSNTAARLVEQMHAARLPFVVLDPTDTWWGVKASADGAGPGLTDVYVFGGRKADLPLEAGGGTLIADVLCEHRMSMVLSVKHLSGRARSAFMVAFAQTLFQKWAGGPLHVVLEEAHELAPQIGGRGGGDDGEAAMLGAFKRLWKLGRASGIGGTAVTQRPASLSKDITTQSEILVAHRTIGPQDVKAVGEWIKYHGEQLGVLADLPSLPTGQAIVWAPEFPEGKPLGLVRAIVLRRETYDSASTPKVGEQRIEPKELAPVDLARLRTKMAATIEKAKADDPRELRRQLAELRAELVKAQTVTVSSDRSSDKYSKTIPGGEKPKTIPGGEKPKEIEVLADADRALLRSVAARLGTIPDELSGHLRVMLSQVMAAALDAAVAKHEAATARARAEFISLVEKKAFGRVLEKLDRVSTTPERQTVSPAQRPRLRTSPSTNPGLTRPGPTRDAAVAMAKHLAGGAGVPPVQQRILNALAELEQLGARQPARELVAFMAGYTHLQSKGFVNAMSALSTAGFIVYGAGTVALTPEGRLRSERPAAPRSAREVQDRVIAMLGGASGRILEPLIEAYPKAMARDDVAARAGYGHLQSKGFVNAISRLRTLGFVDYPDRGSIVAKPVLFLEA